MLKLVCLSCPEFVTNLLSSFLLFLASSKWLVVITTWLLFSKAQIFLSIHSLLCVLLRLLTNCNSQLSCPLKSSSKGLGAKSILPIHQMSMILPTPDGKILNSFRHLQVFFNSTKLYTYKETRAWVSFFTKSALWRLRKLINYKTGLLRVLSNPNELLYLLSTITEAYKQKERKKRLKSIK